ncbi:bHLH transcription factor RHL1-like isoform X2 [Humulus lupulus]|uniref:bHLH transcription factor RHL1-like isoform X2 n=1 Tax=Humulus lupulus TaxID=3486 RepID=UPI002B417E81|nr:bHLH transcription factor RHL1-like isoform X2 [Humulus lupulus]
MEGECSKNNVPMQVKSSNFVGYSGNGVTLGPTEENDRQGSLLMGNGGRSWLKENDALRLPWWVQVQHPETNHNYVQFLTEKSSAFPQMPFSSQDILESLSLPDGETASAYAVSGVSDVQRDVRFYNHLGLASGPKPTDIDAWKNLTSSNKNSVGKGYNSRVDIPSATVASPGDLSRGQSTIQRQRNTKNDRQRRIRYAERLNALQELLPQSAEGGQVSVFDGVIDYIKYLQLQIKDLSKSRLGGESPTKPIIFREGYGHYFCDQENEPLEEIIMAKWLELNPLAVTKLLEMKGLLLMPIEFTEALV